MISNARKSVVSVLIIIVGLASAFFLTRYIEHKRPPLPHGYEDEDLTVEGSRLKGFVFGAEGLVADWYWMNSLQYIGNKITAVGLDNLNLDDLTPLNPRLLYPYLKNATDLDPRFIAPYSYGATILPAIDSQQAIALTEKGIANNPNQWRLHQYLGYIYWRQKDYEKAAEVYVQGAAIPGSPAFMKMMAARMKAEGGSRDTARAMYGQILAESQDEVSRQNAELRLMQIDSFDDRDMITAALTQFRDATGRCPSNWQELLPTLQKQRAVGHEPLIDRSNNLVDPSGAPYSLNGATCTVELGPDTKIPRL